MSNGQQCCALEICCPNEPERRIKLVQSIAADTGADESYCNGFLDWMESNHLIFAPVEFAATIARIAAIAHAHPKADV
jgi:hypothetical protein